MKAPTPKQLVCASLVAVISGCGDGGGGGPKVYGSGTRVIEGECDLSGDGIDTHRVRPEASGTLYVSLVWNDSQDADLDLTLWAYGDDLELLDSDWNSPPGDSPAEMSTAIAAGVKHDVDVECLGGSDGESYEVTIAVP